MCEKAGKSGGKAILKLWESRKKWRESCAKIVAF